MLGDLDQVLDGARARFDALGIRPGGTRRAIDLGAGPGLHALVLAERGFRVLAIDSCPSLLAELETLTADLPVRGLRADLCDFARHHPEPADLVTCLGDTLTHVPTPAAVETLLCDVARTLAPRGVFVASFRDYTGTPARGGDRFVPVRADADRILTCFLELEGERVQVHDLLHERGDAGWSLRVSSYPKLRLDPAFVADALSRAGLRVASPERHDGLVWFHARRD
ncbi:MAG: class I SAM-dependent methyltransferase [Proteobacteria bacterium]|nr:class I SAM-dependent methyltransferase [Pseudomonadota bacterium]